MIRKASFEMTVDGRSRGMRLSNEAFDNLDSAFIENYILTKVSPVSGVSIKKVSADYVSTVREQLKSGLASIIGEATRKGSSTAGSFERYQMTLGLDPKSAPAQLLSMVTQFHSAVYSNYTALKDTMLAGKGWKSNVGDVASTAIMMAGLGIMGQIIKDAAKGKIHDLEDPKAVRDLIVQGITNSGSLS